MSRKTLFILWAVLFGLCAALGFLPEPEGPLGTALTVLSVFSFLPPALLIHQAGKQADRHTLLLIRNLSALSLGLTLVLLVLNFWSALGPETLGAVLYGLLVVVSSPMICSGQWALSLFLWACLLMVSLRFLRKQRS